MWERDLKNWEIKIEDNNYIGKLENIRINISELVKLKLNLKLEWRKLGINLLFIIDFLECLVWIVLVFLVIGCSGRNEN